MRLRRILHSKDLIILFSIPTNSILHISTQTHALTAKLYILSYMIIMMVLLKLIAGK